jgi:MFS family permease
VAAAADWFLNSLTFPNGYAAIVLLGAGLLLVSSLSFVFAGEPVAPHPSASSTGFADFLRSGIEVFRRDSRFRLFVHAQWLGGAVTMALPFYVLQVIATEGTASQVAFLLAAQTAGALLSNALWGWWGDRYGKRSLYEGVALLRAVPPLLIIVWISMVGIWPIPTISGFVTVFFLLGAVGNGITIAVIGYLMEISPDDRRPAYSGYFNALVAPAALLPLAGAAIVEATSLTGVFAVSLVAAFLQFLIIRRLRDLPAESVK